MVGSQGLRQDDVPRGFNDRHWVRIPLDGAGASEPRTEPISLVAELRIPARNTAHVRAGYGSEEWGVRAPPGALPLARVYQRREQGAALLLWAAPFIDVASWGASEAVTANLLRPRQLYLAVAVSEDPTCGESVIE